MEDFLDLDLTLSCTAIVLSVFHDYFDLVIVSAYEIFARAPKSYGIERLFIDVFHLLTTWVME